MALTQDQWLSKLRRFVPAWMFEDEGRNLAIFNGMAKLLADHGTEADDLIDQTFLLEASDSYLDLHGSERGVRRLAGEEDDAYRERIRYIRNSIALNTIFPAVKAVLNNGDPIIIENWQYGFADSELFCDCEDSVYLDRTRIYNRFTVIIPIQTGGDEEAIKTLIVQVLDQNRALGVFADVLYRTA